MKSFHLPGIHPCCGDSVISIYYRFSILKINTITQAIRSDQISRSVMSDSLRPRESQHTRPPCPSLTPGVHSDSRPSSQWCHPAISSSVVPLSSCLQSLPASESFPMSQLFAWGGQSTGVSALASVLPNYLRKYFFSFVFSFSILSISYYTYLSLPWEIYTHLLPLMEILLGRKLQPRHFLNTTVLWRVTS